MAVVAMLWVAAAACLLLLVGPPLVATVEGAWWRAGPRDIEFWSLARTVAGTCHVPWGRRGAPVVRFPLPDGEARLSAVRALGRRGWIIEARAYQRKPFRFAARLHAPPAAPARWRSPGLAPLEVFAEEVEHLPACSLETTDERLLRWLLRHGATRRAVDELREEAGAEAMELVLAGTVIVLRAIMPPRIGAGAAAETAGPALVAALRRLSADLDDLAEALEETDERVDGPVCRACGGALGADPAVCRGCGARAHRGCRELAGGCVEAGCPATPDAVPAARRVEVA
jgi:hypothetical protein